MRLYHFTCDHRMRAIAADGVVRPYPQPALGGDALSWWSSAAAPTAAALGLDGRGGLVTCDRMAHRLLSIDNPAIMPWTVARGEFPRMLVLQLEASRGARPALWWIARVPVPVT